MTVALGRRRLVGFVLAIGLVVGSVAALPAPRVSAAGLPAWTGGVSLYRDGVFTTQRSWLWCTAAGVQIVRNIVEHKADHSTSNQRRYFDWMRDRNRYDLPVSAGVDPTGWTAGLRHFVDDRYRLVSSRSFEGAIRAAVTRLRLTGLPVALAVSHGNHGWILTGFRATADPATTSSFRVTSVRVTGPLYGLQSKNGYDMPPNTKLSIAELKRFFTPWRYAPKRMIWDGRYVSIQPIPVAAANTVAPTAPRAGASAPAPLSSPVIGAADVLPIPAMEPDPTPAAQGVALAPQVVPASPSPAVAAAPVGAEVSPSDGIMVGFAAIIAGRSGRGGPGGQAGRTARSRLAGAPAVTNGSARPDARATGAADRPWVEDLLASVSAVRVARRGELLTPLDHPMLVATAGGVRVGLLTYVVKGSACEILTLHAVERWCGVGTMLIEAVGRCRRGGGMHVVVGRYHQRQRRCPALLPATRLSDPGDTRWCRRRRAPTPEARDPADRRSRHRYPRRDRTRAAGRRLRRSVRGAAVPVRRMRPLDLARQVGDLDELLRAGRQVAQPDLARRQLVTDDDREMGVVA